MSEWAKTLGHLGWTASLYGAEQILKTARRQFPERDLDLLSADLRSRLGSGFQLLCRAGEDLQAEGWALLQESGEGEGEEGWRALAEALGNGARKGVRSLLAPEEGRLARQELRNRVEVVRLVVESHGSAGRDVDGGEELDLATAVREVLELEPRRQLWAFEGLGHAVGAAALRQREEPTGLLGPSVDIPSPETALPMLHAGLGLAVAEACLGGSRLEEGGDAVERALRRFLRLCCANSRPGHEEGTWDSLGFYCRSQAPEWVEPLARAVEAQGNRELLGMFWHGAGRALYFLPSAAVAGLAGEAFAVKLALREGKTAYALHNLQAGLGVAATLTNLAHPAVVEQLLAAHGHRLLPGFAQGVASAAVIRSALTEDWTAVETWLRHRPAPEVSALWETAALRPFHRGLAGERDPWEAPLPFLALNLRLRAGKLQTGVAGVEVG